MSEQLTIFTLGGLQISQRGIPLADLALRKAEALFVYLACIRRPQPREVLADLFWDERSPAQSLGSLRMALSSLRTRLAPYLTITRAMVAFNYDSPHWLDIAEFQQHLDAARSHGSRGGDLSPEAVQDLEQAVALYRGPFLQGFYLRDASGFEEWMLMEQERLQRLVTAALQDLVTAYLGRGEYSAGILHASRLLQIDPLDEEMHRQLMRLLAYSGQRAAALEQYQACQRILSAELGVAPDPATTELYESIRLGKLESVSTVPGSAGLAAGERTHKLPAQLTPFIGREAEKAALVKCLSDPGCRLVTLVGPGGIGKSRLALQVVTDVLHEFEDGVWFVELAPLTLPDLVGPTIAAVLGVKEVAGRDLLDTLKDAVRDKQMLLVLDNFEQVVGAAPLVGALLSAAPCLKVLVTSRAPLRLYGEREYVVPPMRLPDPEHLPPLDRLSQYEAVRLFIERAQDVKRDFQVTSENAPSVAEICVRLDGLPLAIELAAARVRLFPPQALLSRLSNRLKVLTGGAMNLPPRQQTLRRAIEWSYDLLDEGEKQLFRRMSVFQGGRTLQALETVCNVEGDLRLDVLAGVESLVTKSMLQQREGHDGEPRFWMLETIHEYARDKLSESEEEHRFRACHLDYFVTLAEETASQLQGPHQAERMALLDLEMGNLRMAIQWALEHGEEEKVARIAGALWGFMWTRGYLSEGRQWLEAALQSQSLRAEVRATALRACGILAHDCGDYERARACFEEALHLRQQLGDKSGMAGALNALGVLFNHRGEYEQAHKYYKQALGLFQELGDRARITVALNNLGVVAERQGDYEQTRLYYSQSLDMARSMGDTEGSAWALDNLGNLAYQQGDYAQAIHLHKESLAMFRALGHKQGIAVCLEHLAGALGALAQPDIAASLYGAAECLREATGSVMHAAYRAGYERRVSTARAFSNDEAWEEAWQRGRDVPLERTIEHALNEAVE
ncbi:MAG TPA: BTAD domain-containing putative transcriptional regulator [Chloroflexia bacterium]|nr:BTAD domain-containing putative transcriptional regulator [Chloroflexia bacterium]